jgi:glucokinase
MLLALLAIKSTSISIAKTQVVHNPDIAVSLITADLSLAGGIPPRIYNFINKDKIEESFLKCDEMEPLLAGIPIYLNLNSKTALYGAAYYGAFSE